MSDIISISPDALGYRGGGAAGLRSGDLAHVGAGRGGQAAYAKGVSLGILEPKPELVREGAEHLGEGEQLFVGLLGKPVPVVQTLDGLRAVAKGTPGNPARIVKYLAAKFGDRLDDAWRAMAELAAAHERVDLVRRGFRLYEAFGPGVPAGESGWGAKGELDLDSVRAMTAKAGG